MHRTRLSESARTRDPVVSLGLLLPAWTEGGKMDALKLFSVAAMLVPPSVAK